MTRLCVFCGEPASSKEHIWPDWAGRMLRDAGTLPHAAMVGAQGAAPSLRRWEANAHSMTVGVVCRNCNNGWMSRLEDGAEPYLRSMLQGRGRLLHRGGQRILSAWAVKTSMMAEHSAGATKTAIPSVEYEYLHAHGYPSDAVRVWMTTYAGGNIAAAQIYGLDAEIEQSRDRGWRDIWGGTIVFGPAAFQVFGTSIDGLEPDLRRREPPAVHQLWPYQGAFEWSPATGFGDVEILDFADAIPGALIRAAGGLST